MRKFLMLVTTFVLIFFEISSASDPLIKLVRNYTKDYYFRELFVEIHGSYGIQFLPKVSKCYNEDGQPVCNYLSSEEIGELADNYYNSTSTPSLFDFFGWLEEKGYTIDYSNSTITSVSLDSLASKVKREAEQEFIEEITAAYDTEFTFISSNETKLWPYNEAIRDSSFLTSYQFTELYKGMKSIGIIDIEINATLNGTLITGVLYSPLLEINISGNGSVLAYSNNLSSQMPECADINCEIPFPEEDSVLLTAVPANGYLFFGWDGDCAECENNTECTITMDTDKTCNAIFRALEPDISVSPTSYDFGMVQVGNSAEKDFIVQNVGTEDLNIVNVTISTDISEFFITQDNCSGTVLSQGENCTIKITFNPQSVGSKSATLKITSDDPDENTVSIALSGTGVPNQPPVIESFTANPTSGYAPLTVNFTCTAYDPDGSVASYEFDPGDGSDPINSETGSFTYTYETPGTYHATCTSYDNDGASTTSEPVTIEVNPAAVSMADLVVTKLATPRYWRAGKTGRVSILIENQGEEDVTEPFVVRAVVHSAAPGFVIGEQTINGLAAGKRKLVRFRFRVPAELCTPINQHTLYVTVDAENQISETDEGNNTKEKPIVIRGCYRF